MVSSRFTFYPLFRLSVALATGIFLSDVFALDGTYLYALCFVFVLSVLLSSIFYFSKTYRIRFLFGISVSLSFLLLGGILFVYIIGKYTSRGDLIKKRCMLLLYVIFLV